MFELSKINDFYINQNISNTINKGSNSVCYCFHRRETVAKKIREITLTQWIYCTDHIEPQAIFSGTQNSKFSISHIQNKTNKHKLIEKSKLGIEITTVTLEIYVL